MDVVAVVFSYCQDIYSKSYTRPYSPSVLLLFYHLSKLSFFQNKLLSVYSFYSPGWNFYPEASLIMQYYVQATFALVSILKIFFPPNPFHLSFSSHKCSCPLLPSSSAAKLCLQQTGDKHAAGSGCIHTVW